MESRPSPFQVVFEDDGDTAYLYVMDHRRGPEQPIIDALHIYNAADERDGDPIDLQIVWTTDGAGRGAAAGRRRGRDGGLRRAALHVPLGVPAARRRRAGDDARLGPGGVRRPFG